MDLAAWHCYTWWTWSGSLFIRICNSEVIWLQFKSIETDTAWIRSPKRVLVGSVFAFLWTFFTFVLQPPTEELLSWWEAATSVLHVAINYQLAEVYVAVRHTLDQIQTAPHGRPGRAFSFCRCRSGGFDWRRAISLSQKEEQAYYQDWNDVQDYALGELSLHLRIPQFLVTAFSPEWEVCFYVNHESPG